jgi:hypothetical protein
MPSIWATRRASSTSATEQQPESDTPPTASRWRPPRRDRLDEQSGGHRRVDAATHRYEDFHRSSLPVDAALRLRAQSRARRPRESRITASTSSVVVSAPIDRRSDPRARSGSKRPWPPARDWGRRRHSNSSTRPTRTRPPGPEGRATRRSPVPQTSRARSRARAAREQR